MEKATLKGTHVLRELVQVQRMNLGELKKKWFELYGRPAPECGRLFLQRQLAVRIQERLYGGISSSTRKALEAIAESPRPVKNNKGIFPGTQFEREWKGQTYLVTANKDGFEYNGHNYKSLSGVAFAITGTQWSGKKFFGVK